MILCQCEKITRAQLEEAVKDLPDGEVMSPSRLFRALGVPVRCGGCVPALIREMRSAARRDGIPICCDESEIRDACVWDQKIPVLR